MGETSRLIISKNFPVSFKWDINIRDAEIAIYGLLVHKNLHFFKPPSM
jgi:hypothetical protein